MTFEHDQLLSALGSPITNHVVERFRRFAHIPTTRLDSLHGRLLHEEWGANSYALKKYLSVQIAWSIEQKKYTVSDTQFYVTAGQLQTRYGTPLYLVFERNEHTGPDQSPFYCVHAGSDISAPELPVQPEIPPSPELVRGAEIVMAHEHILGANADRVEFLKDTPPVAQICAVSGAIQWSLNRDLQIPYWYFGRMGYVVPLYLRTRENITLAPDLVAPIQVMHDSLVVRTALVPHMPYTNARVAVPRHDQLPAWMLDAWNEHASVTTEAEIENPEGAGGDHA
jgi:hypothetical protein